MGGSAVCRIYHLGQGLENNKALVGLCVIIFITNYPGPWYVGNECTYYVSGYKDLTEFIPSPPPHRRQREVVTPRLFEVAHSGHKELIFQILENGDDMNPTVSTITSFPP